MERHPDVSTEFKSSDAVITGYVVSSRNESSPEDPQGYEDTVYTIRVLDVFKGKVGQLLELTSENTSARFPMDVGKKYLLFVKTGRVPDSLQPFGLETYVDSCGNSATLDEKKAELGAVRRMSG